jgi:hypothetical protein
LPPESVSRWKDLERKFHAHYFSGSSEKKLIDLATLKQRHSEMPLEFLRRFREVKGMCFSLNLPDDQLADMAVAGMLPAVREKLFGMEFEKPWPAVSKAIVDEQPGVWLQEGCQVWQAA